MRTRKTLLLLLVSMIALAPGALAACNLTGKTVVLTATPSLPPNVTPTIPYVTPTPDLVMTPTPPPDLALESARQAVRYGNYEQAVTSYQEVLARSDASPDLHAAAAYGLGDAALREGRYAEAVQSLSDFMSSFPSDPRVAHALYLRAEAYMGLAQYTSAINDFQMYLTIRPGIIDSYAYERIGNAYDELGNFGEAMNAYVKAADAGRAPPELAELREQIAWRYQSGGNTQAAIAQYDAILAVATNDSYRAEVEYGAAQLEFLIERDTNAYARLQRVVENYPDTSYAYQAVTILQNNNIAVNPLRRGLIAYWNEDYPTAIEAFNTHLAQSDPDDTDILMKLGLSYRNSNNFEAATLTFKAIVDQRPDDPLFGDAWLEWGRTLFRSGDTAGAAEVYLGLVEARPDLPQSAEALWRVGYLYRQNGDITNALATFEQLAEQYPGTEWAVEGLLIGAQYAEQSGYPGAAAQFYNQLAVSATGETQSQAYMWIGRLYLNEGKADLASQAFAAAAQADPTGFYGLRAADLQHGRAPYTPPDQVDWTLDEAAALTEAENWLRDIFSLTQSGPLYQLGPALQMDPRVARGRELLIVGAYEDAELELESLRQDFVEDPLATYQLTLYFRDLGLYKLSINAAATLIESTGFDTLHVPEYLARLRFPIYYQDLVLEACQGQDLDPLLVFSLIRQESLFEGFATSYAYAQGLMQIIPDTGQWIADRIGWPNYENSDVYRPYINVRFGTYYLRWILDLEGIDGTEFAALAGYNGGPMNAIGWLAESGPDIDAFIQAIDFPESQLYVRRIYEHYGIYRALYGVSS